MNHLYLIDLLKIRLLVGYLGEKAQLSWWPTAFFEPSSKLFLEPVFTKTVKTAQYHGVVAAASRSHDEHLNLGCYHLFRLPEETEQDLYNLLNTEDISFYFQQVFQSKEVALSSLSEFSSESIQPSEGPIRLCTISELESIEMLSKLAATYLSAFKNQIQTFPYFVS